MRDSRATSTIVRISLIAETDDLLNSHGVSENAISFGNALSQFRLDNKAGRSKILDHLPQRSSGPSGSRGTNTQPALRIPISAVII